jgi:nitroimidazol reductase NimA-like FMN-containing flavoprotein (pyridoxamine 5'-phosphate oxidase superfamily)
MKHANTPQVDRPWFGDPTYGVPRHRKDLLPWSHVSRRMEEARVYWATTVDPQGRPHATPVDGLWRDDALYFGGSPTTRRNRNLETNPAVCLHLESGSDVVILHGQARLTKIDETMAAWLAEASTRKYGFPAKPQDFREGVHVFRPSVAFAWAQFPKDVTRFRFGPDREA